MAKKTKAKTKPAEKDKRRMWSKEDVKTLRAMAKAKKPVAEIAKAVKRTPGATRQKAFTEGLSLDTR